MPSDTSLHASALALMFTRCLPTGRAREHIQMQRNEDQETYLQTVYMYAQKCRRGDACIPIYQLYAVLPAGKMPNKLLDDSRKSFTAVGCST